MRAGLLAGGGATDADPIGALSPAAWYEAQLETGLSDNDTPSTITDQSGNGRDLSQVSTYSATYKTSIVNSRPIWRCVDSEYVAASNWASAWTEGELFIVCEADNDPAAAPNSTPGHPFDMAGQTSSGVHYPWNTGAIFESFASTSRVSNNPTPSLASFHAYNAYNDGSASGYNLSVNGTIFLTVTNTVGFAVTPRLGAQTYGGTRRPWPGDIAMILVFDYVLTTDQRDTVESYINTEYSITFS